MHQVRVSADDGLEPPSLHLRRRGLVGGNAMGNSGFALSLRPAKRRAIDKYARARDFSRVRVRRFIARRLESLSFGRLAGFPFSRSNLLCLPNRRLSSAPTRRSGNGYGKKPMHKAHQRARHGDRSVHSTGTPKAAASRSTHCRASSTEPQRRVAGARCDAVRKDTNAAVYSRSPLRGSIHARSLLVGMLIPRCCLAAI
jgi:hypothetical protein